MNIEKQKYIPDITILPECIEHQIFLEPQLQPLGVSGITKLSNPYLQGNGVPKKRLDAALAELELRVHDSQITYQFLIPQTKSL